MIVNNRFKKGFEVLCNEVSNSLKIPQVVVAVGEGEVEPCVRSCEVEPFKIPLG